MDSEELVQHVEAELEQARAVVERRVRRIVPALVVGAAQTYRREEPGARRIQPFVSFLPSIESNVLDLCVEIRVSSNAISCLVDVVWGGSGEIKFERTLRTDGEGPLADQIGRLGVEVATCVAAAADVVITELRDLASRGLKQPPE